MTIIIAKNQCTNSRDALKQKPWCLCYLLWKSDVAKLLLQSCIVIFRNRFVSNSIDGHYLELCLGGHYLD